MMIDPHAKYIKSRSKDEKVMAWTGKHLKKQLFDLKVKGQGHMKVTMVRNTPSHDDRRTCQIS